MTRRANIAAFLAAGVILASATGSFAMMGGGGWGGWTGGCGWTNGSGGMMTGTGGFGMMNGRAGTPVVGADGTTYVVSMLPTSTPGPTPTWQSFKSHLLAISASGELLNLTIDGMLSKPVIGGGALIATASLPNKANYSIAGNYGATTTQSVLYWLQLPLSSSSVPTAVLMDGRFASEPVVSNGKVYVTTTNGVGMMIGNDVFNNTFPQYTGGTTPKSYLYVFTVDGTFVSKTVLQ